MLWIYNINKYDFGVASFNRVAPVAGLQIPIKPMISKKVMGFLYYFPSLIFDAGSFLDCKARPPGTNRQPCHKQTFLLIASYVFKVKIWMKKYLYWKQYCKGLAKPSQNSWCGSHASGNCVPDKNEGETKL